MVFPITLDAYSAIKRLSRCGTWLWSALLLGRCGMKSLLAKNDRQTTWQWCLGHGLVAQGKAGHAHSATERSSIHYSAHPLDDLEAQEWLRLWRRPVIYSLSGDKHQRGGQTLGTSRRPGVRGSFASHLGCALIHGLTICNVPPRRM
jgi:hypothetical protein